MPGNVVADDALFPTVEAEIHDGAAIVHMLPPTKAGSSVPKTFKDYAADVVAPYVLRRLKYIQRLDIVWDRYITNSLKQATRNKRGTGEHRHVLPTTPIPSNWQSFLQVDSNKSELFTFLAEYLINEVHHDKVIVTTSDTSVICSDPELDTSGIAPCSHEEADSRIMVHLADCVSRGHSKITIRTTDTDVVVLAVSSMCHLNIEELWIAFGTGKSFRYIGAHIIFSNIGLQRAKALPMFHSLTGCDTVSFFAGHGKKSCWDVWKVYPQLTDALIRLAHAPEKMSADEFDTIQRFVVLLYSRTSDQSNVNCARKQLFSQGSMAIENIPPTEAALQEHCKRAIYNCTKEDLLSLTPILSQPCR